jgi:hypothetical protein
MSGRITKYWSKWRELAMMYGDMCFYCGKEAATTIDHVIPYSYAVDNDIENLRPACALCNCIASDKMFQDVYEKKWYILGKLKHRHDLRHAFCTECGIAYIYREHCPSLFLCPECYDLGNDTDYADFSGWHDWLRLHVQAEWHPDIYRRAGQVYRANRSLQSHKFLVQCLVQSLHEEEARQLTPLSLNITES